MDNKTALFVAILVVGFLLADHFWLEWGALTLAGKWLADTTDWMAFWR